jgi:hypothetical protein
LQRWRPPVSSAAMGTAAFLENRSIAVNPAKPLSQESH